MKNLRFVTGLFLGVVLGVILIFLVTCKSGSGTSTTNLSDSFVLVKNLNDYAPNIYKLTIDNIQYIVVSDRSNGGVAIIKHE
jgi:hypothetical protein